VSWLVRRYVASASSIHAIVNAAPTKARGSLVAVVNEPQRREAKPRLLEKTHSPHHHVGELLGYVDEFNLFGRVGQTRSISQIRSMGPRTSDPVIVMKSA
jgi:hypothetical protein